MSAELPRAVAATSMAGVTAPSLQSRGRGLACAVLAALAGLVCISRGDLADADLWWHLRTGQWILAERQWPAVDSFSQAAGQPWTAYSWLPEVVLHAVYGAWGLRGAVLLTAVMAAAIVASLYRLVNRLFPVAPWPALLSTVAFLSMLPSFTPRPWLVSILLAIVEIDILVSALNSGRYRRLLWLVPLFIVWANCHIQFVLGLAILSMAIAGCGLQWQLERPEGLSGDPARAAKWLTAVGTVCFLAAMVNPYGYKVYVTAFELVRQTGPLGDIIEELRAMPFRDRPNWLALALAVAGVFSLGRKPDAPWFIWLLMALACYLGFHSQRDAWLLSVAGVTAVGVAASRSRFARRVEKPAASCGSLIYGAACVGVLIVTASFVQESRLEAKVAKVFPVGAAQYLNQHAAQGRIFNPFGWGGYLMWSVPQLPPSIDGRTIVHGTERVVRHAHTLAGGGSWQSDPELAAATVLVLRRDSALASLVRIDPEFRLLYQDSVATIVERRPLGLALQQKETLP